MQAFHPPPANVLFAQRRAVCFLVTWRYVGLSPLCCGEKEARHGAHALTRSLPGHISKYDLLSLHFEVWLFIDSILQSMILASRNTCESPRGWEVQRNHDSGLCIASSPTADMMRLSVRQSQVQRQWRGRYYIRCLPRGSRRYQGAIYIILLVFQYFSKA